MHDLQAKAIADVAALSAAVSADLDEINGGIGWWSGYNINPADRFDLADYLVGVIEGVSSHLGIAESYLAEYRQKRMTDDFQLRAWARDHPSEPVFRGTSTADAEKRNKLMSAQIYGFFNAASSVLDTLAGTVIGVAGLNLHLVRADLAMFGPVTSDPDYPAGTKRLRKALAEDQDGQAAQLGLVRAFRTSLQLAGPTDWHLWLNNKRNQLAHRGARIQMINIDHAPRSRDHRRSIVFERDPDQTSTQSFRDSQRPDLNNTMWLREDQETTMTGILGSLQAAVIGTIAPSLLLWEQRRTNPALIHQPAAQWVEPRETIEFPGYDPQPDLFKNVAAMVVHPSTATRLSASQVLHNPQTGRPPVTR